MKKFIICCCLLSLSFLNTYGQRVGDAKDEASSHRNGGNRSERRGRSSSRGSVSEDIFVSIVAEIMFAVFVEAQREQLALAADDDWRISLEANVLTGVDPNNIEFFNSQTVRGNWGLFSTQFRRFDVHDVTARFTTLDWQIVQFNVVNKESFRWLFGLGLSHEVEIGQTHPEFSTEVQFSLFNQKLTPSLTYRRSDDGYPRTEYSALVAYRPFSMKRAELMINAGYVFQRLYGIPFNFPSIGLGFYLK